MSGEKEYYRKAYKTLHLLRYIVLVLTFATIVISMTAYKNDITADNFRYLMKYIEISPPDILSGGKNITFSVSSSSDFSMLGEKLLVTEADEMSIYDFSGRRVYNEEQSFKNPVTLTNGKYTLVYDLDGYSLSVYNSFSKVHEKTLKTPIESVYLSKNGGFAVITKEKGYAGGFKVYDSSYSELFSRNIYSAPITDICYDDDGGFLAACTTDVKNGDFYSKISFFDFDALTEKTAELYGQMPLKMLCHDGRIALITDLGINYYSYSGESVGFSSFGYDILDSVYSFTDVFAAVTSSSVAGTEVTVGIYDFDGNLLYTEDFRTRAISMDLNHGKLYVLEQFNLNIIGHTEEYNFNGEKTEIPLDGEYKKVFSLEDGEYLLVSGSGASKFTSYEETEEESKND